MTVCVTVCVCVCVCVGVTVCVTVYLQYAGMLLSHSPCSKITGKELKCILSYDADSIDLENSKM